MPEKLTLAYWPLRGLAGSIRVYLKVLGIEFEDKTYSFSDWEKDKYGVLCDQLLFPNLPYLMDGNVKISQSLSIMRYLGRKYGFVGQSEQDTIRLEQFEQEVLDLRFGLTHVVYSQKSYEDLRADWLKKLPFKLERLDKAIGSNSWILGEKITYVDLMLWEELDRIFAFTETEAILNNYANLKNFINRLEELPNVKDYINNGFLRSPYFGPYASWTGSQKNE